MQPLTAPPRDHLTEEQVEASLAWQHSTKLRWGIDVLNSQLQPTGIVLDVTDGAVSWQWRAQPVDGQAPVSAQVRRTASLRYRHQALFNPLGVLYRPWVEMLGPPLPPPAGGFANSFEGIADGVAVTTVNSGTDGQSAFSAVAGSVLAETDAAMFGAVGLKAEIAASTESYVAWTVTGTTHFLRAYIRTPAANTINSRLMWNGVAGSTTLGWDIRETVSIDRIAFAVHNVNQFSLGIDGVNEPLTPNTVYRVEAKVVTGAAGTAEVRLYDAAGTLLDSDTFAGALDAATEIKYGIGNGVNANQVWQLDAIGYSDTDWLGAWGSSAPWVRWHLGVFTAVMPPFEYDGFSDADGPLVWRPLELADRSHFWQSDETPDPVTVPVGTDIVQFVQDDLGVRFNELDVSGVANGGTLATQDYVFDAGTPWLQVYNTLLAAIGNEPLHADADGLPRSQPLTDPEQQPAEHSYSFATTVVPQARVEAVNPELPNTVRFVARRSEDLAEEGDMIRTVVNESTGPASRQQRGGRTVLVRVEVDAQTQDELDAQARALAPFYFAGGGLRYVGQVGLNPRHSDSDVVFLERPALGIDGNWLVTSWSIRLGTADEMRVMDLQLEQLTGAAFVSLLPVPVGAFGTYMFGEHEFGGPV